MITLTPFQQGMNAFENEYSSHEIEICTLEEGTQEYYDWFLGYTYKDLMVQENMNDDLFEPLLFAIEDSQLEKFSLAA